MIAFQQLATEINDCAERTVSSRDLGTYIKRNGVFVEVVHGRHGRNYVYSLDEKHYYIRYDRHYGAHVRCGQEA